MLGPHPGELGFGGMVYWLAAFLLAVLASATVGSLVLLLVRRELLLRLWVDAVAMLC